MENGSLGGGQDVEHLSSLLEATLAALAATS